MAHLVGSIQRSWVNRKAWALLDARPMPKLPLYALCLLALPACNRSYSGHHTYAMEMCVANIPVFAPGQVPQVPYAMIAPLDSHWGVSATSRFQHMKMHACQLGADGIIDTPDRYPSMASVTTTMQYDAYGHPVAVQQQAVVPAGRTNPIAIKFLGQPPMLAQQQMMGPPTNVTIVPPPSTVTIIQPPPEVRFVQQE
jgi:hypothetical protein